MYLDRSLSLSLVSCPVLVTRVGVLNLAPAGHDQNVSDWVLDEQVHQLVNCVLLEHLAQVEPQA